MSVIEKLERLDATMTAANWQAIGNTLYIGDAFWPMPGQVADAQGIAELRNMLGEIIRELEEPDLPAGMRRASKYDLWPAEKREVTGRLARG